MKVAHVALWTRDLEAAANFWREYFGATVGPEYHSARRPGFISRFISLPGAETPMELMAAPWLEDAARADRVGWDHIAISLGSTEAVNDMAARCQSAGLLLSAPRTTGDGFYEALIAMPDGTPIEITS